MEFVKLAKIVLNAPKGAFTHVEWEKELPVRAALKNTYKVTKHTSAVVKFGVQYDNISAVKDKRADGTLPAVNAGLTWGEWNIYPYFIRHKNTDYVRCTVSHNNVMHTEYRLNGVPCTKQMLETICTKAAFASGETPDVLTIKVDNITRIG